MRGPSFHAAVAAAGKLLDAVTPADRVGLVTFAGRVQVESELTHDVAAVRLALSQLRTGRGTALDAGVTKAVEVAGTNTDARRLVVLMSDGADTTGPSQTQLDTTLSASGVEVDAFGLNRSDAFTSTPLEEIAAVTGGRYANVTSQSLAVDHHSAPRPRAVRQPTSR